MKRFFRIAMIFCLFILLTSCKSNTQNSLRVYNWGDYIDPITLTMFEREFGVKVTYETFSSNEDLYVKVKKSSDSYDVIVPSDYMIERMIAENLIQKIDFKNVPNFAGVFEDIKNPDFDPTNEYSIPYFWGTVGIIYNKKLIDYPVSGFKDLWDKRNVGKIIMYNSIRDAIAVALKYKGYSVNTTDKAALMEAKDALMEQKPLVYAYLADEGRDVIVQEDAAIGLMYSGDALMMMEENKNLDYVIPKEGTNLWYDSFAIPKNAKNKDLAEKFINFMLRPEISAINTEYCVGYTSPVIKTRELLRPELRDSKVIYPSRDDLKKMEVYKNIPEILPIYDRIWTEVIATMK
ncbi:spermidine/putrescine ABC transporter substrate-binding protein [Peptoniphilus sp. GNH]|nr:spermidine/putrescine ABC transporter substrate-binding protein [Peptoniphilus sp. GNH]